MQQYTSHRDKVECGVGYREDLVDSGEVSKTQAQPTTRKFE
jgi:hypothetical protein